MPFYDDILTNWGFTKEDYKVGMGSDKSHSYMNYKNAVFYVATDDQNQRVIAFKPFVEKISIGLNPKLNELESVFNGTKMITPLVASIDYQVTLKIPATSVNESRLNKRKLELFRTFADPSLGRESEFIGTGELAYGELRQLMFFTNLINNGNIVPGDDFIFRRQTEDGASYKELKKRACQGVFQQISYSVVTDDGYFEYQGRLFPKTYSCDITFIAFNQQKMDDADTYLTDGYYDRMGKATELSLSNGWPFGIKVSRKGTNALSLSGINVKGVNYNFLAENNVMANDQYFYDKKAGFYIFPASDNEDFSTVTGDIERFEGLGLYFKPAVDSYSYQRKTGAGDLFNTQYTSTFLALPASPAEVSVSLQVPSENISEALLNHAKIQELIRFISPIIEGGNSVYTEKKSQTYLKILFSNVIYNEGLFADSIDPYVVGAGFNELSAIGKQYDYKMYSVAGKPFFLKNLSYSPDMESGFFEFEGYLFPKAFKLSFSLTENYSAAERANNYTTRRNRYAAPKKE